MNYQVGHAQWVFTIPKILRAYFLRNRELLGDLSRAAWETVRALMAEAADDPGVRPGMVVVPQTFGSSVNVHPHVHAIASRGGWTKDGTWVPIPYVDSNAAARLFRHKVLRLLLAAGRIDAERVELILGWRLRERLLGSQRGRGPGRRRGGPPGGSRVTSPGRQ